MKTALAVRVMVVPGETSMKPSEGSVNGVQSCRAVSVEVDGMPFCRYRRVLRTGEEGQVVVGLPLNSSALFHPSREAILGDYTDPAAAVGACAPIEGQTVGARCGPRTTKSTDGLATRHSWARGLI